MSESKKHVLTYYAPVFLCLLATILAWRWAVAMIEHEQRQTFEFQTRDIEDGILKRMQAYEQVLRGGLGLMNAARGEVDRGMWRAYVESLAIEDRYPGIQGIGFAARIAPEMLDHHVRAIRAEGFPDYTVRPGGERSEYTAIIYLEPFTMRNKRAFGYDMFSEEVRHEAMAKARDTGQTTLSGQVKLVQETETDVQAGTLMYLPVYRAGQAPASAEQRRQALVGYVYSPFRMNDLLRGILGPHFGDLDLDIYDGVSPSRESLLFDSDLKVASGGKAEGPLHRETVIDVYGRSWTIHFHALPAFLAKADRRVPAGVLAFGLALSAMVLLVTRTLERTRAKALALAEEMTRGHARELAERKSAVRAEQQRSLELQALLASLPGYAFFKDAHSRYITANNAFCVGVGLTREELAGRTDQDLFGPALAERFQAGDRAILSGVEDELLVEEELSMGGRMIQVATRKVALRDSAGAVAGLIGLALDITEKKRMEEELIRAYAEMEARVASRTRELAEANGRLQAEVQERKQAHRDLDLMIASVSAILVGVDRQGLVRRWNGTAEQAFGRAAGQTLGLAFDSLPLDWDWPLVRQGLGRCLSEQRPVKVNDLRYARRDGKDGFLILSVNPMRSESGEVEGVLLIGDDITDLKLLSAQLSQAQKLESIGQLAAGIAHEINTPTQYVSDSVTFLRDAFTDMRRVLDLYEPLTEEDTCLRPEDHRHKVEEAARVMAEIDYTYLREEAPKAFDLVAEGIERISTIVKAVKAFSHPGEGTWQAVDLNKAVESTLEVSRNEWKYLADVEVDLARDLPVVTCLPGLINQVILNIVVNAAHAIGDVVGGSGDKGRIAVSTRHDLDAVVLTVSDTGGGIPEAIRTRVFDPFFTTKEVGKGTGQGLAIAYDVVVNKHGGTIAFESEEGKGTTFRIRLPIGGPPAAGGALTSH